MYVCYYGWHPHTIAAWFMHELRNDFGNIDNCYLTDCEWIVPGTVED